MTMSNRRITKVIMDPRPAKDLNEHEQIILQEHGVLYYEEENLVITLNREWIKALEFVNPKHKQKHLSDNVPTAVN